MGCASSAHMLSASNSSLLNPPQHSLMESIPKEEDVLKDLPEVVEKVITCLKESDSEHHTNLNPIEILSSLNSVANDNKCIVDTGSENSAQGVVQGYFVDNLSIISTKSVHDGMEELWKLDNKGPTKSADKDSLRTSSPESEIEEVLAKSTASNPPSPEPTFSELQDLEISPIKMTNELVNLNADDLINKVSGNTKIVNYSLNK